MLLGDRGAVDRDRPHRAHHAVLEQHEADAETERQPVLVERDDRDHHEEEEVRLDGTVRLVDDDR
jgi:hypothetical protein